MAAGRSHYARPNTWRPPPDLCLPGRPVKRRGAGKESYPSTPPMDFPSLTEFDHRIAAQVAQIAASAKVHSLFAKLVEDLVESGSGRIRLVAAADDQGADAFLNRSEWTGCLTDLKRQHDLLKCRGKLTQPDLVAGDDFAVELCCDALGTPAATDVARCFGELRHTS